MHWIVEHPPHPEHGTVRLLRILERFGIPHSSVRVVPFIGTLIPDVDVETNNAIVIGKYSMRFTAKTKGWSPGSFDLGDLTYEQIVSHWGERMLNHDAQFMNFGEALDEIKQRNPERSFFIRPTHDTKSFSGELTTPEKFILWGEKIASLDKTSTVNEFTQIIISEPKAILAEYRVFVVKHQPVTASLYKRGNRVIYDGAVEDDIYDYVHSLLLEPWQPHESYVVDIARTPEGLKVIETNTLNSAGFYACDMMKLFISLEEAYTK